MPFDPQLQPGQVIDNETLRNIFQCSGQGGMRMSYRTRTLVLISSARAVYADKWVDGILHYTGMGLTGHQAMQGQNLTLRDSPNGEVDVHLFEVFRPNQYTYRGRVELAGEPYQSTQADREGSDRRVWMFPLRVVQDQALPDATALADAQEERERAALRLDPAELRRRAQAAGGVPPARGAKTNVFSRNPYVAAYALHRAGGVCQLCGKPAPFQKRDRSPYLEVHHIRWLAHGGTDDIENTVALCPNCHRKIHVLDLRADRERLLEVAGA